MNNFKKIKSYEDACKIKGRKPLTISDFSFLPEDEREMAFARHQLINIADAIKEGTEKLDWSNSDQPKWRPWLEWDSVLSRFGFWYSYFNYALTYTSVGSRLCFPTEEMSDYFGSEFIEIHNKATEG